MYLLYFLLWIIYNGNITVEITIFGLVIAGVLFAFTCKFMDYSVKKEMRTYRNIGKFFCYVAILIFEIIKANIVVIRMILSEREEIEPTLVTFRSHLKKPESRAFLANAITLTPGTITVSLEEEKYVVHCLDESLSEGIDSTIFEEKLKEMEEI